jgi:hypothetical protein
MNSSDINEYEMAALAKEFPEVLEGIQVNLPYILQMKYIT